MVDNLLGQFDCNERDKRGGIKGGMEMTGQKKGNKEEARVKEGIERVKEMTQR